MEEELLPVAPGTDNPAPEIEDGSPSIVPEPEAALPPEAQGEPNGGPLGCCLGTVVGIFLAFALVTGLSLVIANGGTFLTVPIVLLGACAGGYLGWRVGKRIYKEYEPPVVKRYAYSASTSTRRAKTRRSKVTHKVKN
jgi:hypothetical protein